MKSVEFSQLEPVQILESDSRLNLVLEFNKRYSLLPWHSPYFLKPRVRLKQTRQHLFIVRLRQALGEQDPMRNYND